MEISHIKGCVIVPTYNNDKTLSHVIEEILKYVPVNRIIVVNDGSTDSTSSILSSFPKEMNIITNGVNRGKGYSLRKGFKLAINLGFENAITIDSDGQHFPCDIPKICEASYANPGFVIMGSRNMEHSDVPNKSSFGNKFSNFWFRIETFIRLPDTQTGFRSYPLQPMKDMVFFTNKFEFEIEVIVRLAWKSVQFLPTNINVKYDADERVSHFRPGRDFFRISILNSILVTIAILFVHPKNILKAFARIVKEEAVKPSESNLSKSLSLGFGVFIGILPIWGFQLLVGIPLAIFFRMNKVLFLAAANISLPPMIPLIIYLSFKMGYFFMGGTSDALKSSQFSLETISSDVQIYVAGAIILACLSFFVVTLLSFLSLRFFRRKIS